jgi:hypothetical protein
MPIAHAPNVQVKVMWKGGPLRRWSASKTTLAPLGFSDGGFVGSYVCAECSTPCEGVYYVREVLKWLCGPCKSKAQPSISGRNAPNGVQRPGDPHLEEGGRR